MNKKIALSALIACALALGFSQTDTYANAPAEDDMLLDSIVITATRTPVEAAKANANITVITAEDIEKNHYQDLSEALRSVPGVYIANSAPAGYETSNSMKINGANEIVVLIDGVKVNSAGQKFSPSMLRDMKNIERIEVLKGSASVLYGADAKGGVINIITKKIDTNHTTFGVSAGSYNKQQYNFSTEGYENGFSYRISAQKDKSGDFKDGHGTTVPNKLDANSISIKLAQELSDKHELGFTYDQYQADTKSRALWETYMHDGKIDNYNWKITLQSDFDDKTSNFFAFSNNMYDTDVENEAVNWSTGILELSNYLTKVKTLRVSDQFTTELSEQHRLTAGFEYTRDEVTAPQTADFYNRAVFLQNEWNLTDALKLTTGFRYDNNSEFGDHTTPSINLGYQFSDKTNAYVGYNEYFIAPTPMYLYGYGGNPNLEEETGKTKEVGINHQFDDTFSMAAHMFWRNAENRIGWDGTQYQNFVEEDARGWDVSFKKQFSDTVSAFVGYTYMKLDANQNEAANANGHLPKHAVNVGIDYTENKWNASIQGRGAFDRAGLENVNGRCFPEETYWVWDIGMNYQADDNTKIFAKVNNLFDKFYAEQSNVAWGAEGQWYTAPGRNFIMGVEYSF